MLKLVFNGNCYIFYRPHNKRKFQIKICKLRTNVLQIIKLLETRLGTFWKEINISIIDAHTHPKWKKEMRKSNKPAYEHWNNVVMDKCSNSGRF